MAVPGNQEKSGGSDEPSKTSIWLDENTEFTEVDGNEVEVPKFIVDRDKTSQEEDQQSVDQDLERPEKTPEVRDKDLDTSSQKASSDDPEDEKLIKIEALPDDYVPPTDEEIAERKARDERIKEDFRQLQESSQNAEGSAPDQDVESSIEVGPSSINVRAQDSTPDPDIESSIVVGPSSVDTQDQEEAVENPFRKELTQFSYELDEVLSTIDNSKVVAQSNRLKEAAKVIINSKDVTEGRKISDKLDRAFTTLAGEIRVTNQKLEQDRRERDEQRVAYHDEEFSKLVTSLDQALEDYREAESDKVRENVKKSVAELRSEIYEKEKTRLAQMGVDLDSVGRGEQLVSSIRQYPPNVKVDIYLTLMRDSALTSVIQELESPSSAEMTQLQEQLHDLDERRMRQEILLILAADLLSSVDENGEVDTATIEETLEELRRDDSKLSDAEQAMALALETVVNSDNPALALGREVEATAEEADLLGEINAQERDAIVSRAVVVRSHANYKNALWSVTREPENNIPKSIDSVDEQIARLEGKGEWVDRKFDDSKLTDDEKFELKNLRNIRSRLGEARNRLNRGETELSDLREKLADTEAKLEGADLLVRGQVDKIENIASSSMAVRRMERYVTTKTQALSDLREAGNLTPEQTAEEYDRFRTHASEAMLMVQNNLNQFQSFSPESEELANNLRDDMDKIYNILKTAEDQNAEIVARQMVAEEQQLAQQIKILLPATAESAVDEEVSDGIVNPEQEDLSDVENRINILTEEDEPSDFEEQINIVTEDQEDEDSDALEDGSVQVITSVNELEDQSQALADIMMELSRQVGETARADTSPISIIMTAAGEVGRPVSEEVANSPEMKDAVQILKYHAKVELRREGSSETTETRSVEESEEILDQTAEVAEERAENLQQHEGMSEFVQALQELRDRCRHPENQITEDDIRERLSPLLDEEGIEAVIGIVLANNRAGGGNVYVNLNTQNGGGTATQQPNLTLPTIAPPPGAVLVPAGYTVYAPATTGAVAATDSNLASRINNLEQGQEEMLRILQNAGNAEASDRLRNGDQRTNNPNINEILEQFRQNNISLQEAAQRIEAATSEDAINGYIERGVEQQNQALAEVMQEFTTGVNTNLEALREQIQSNDRRHQESMRALEARMRAQDERMMNMMRMMFEGRQEGESEFQLPETREATEALITEIEAEITRLEGEQREYEDLQFAAEIPNLHLAALEFLVNEANLPADANREQILNALNNYLENNNVNDLIEGQEGDLNQLRAWLRYRALENLRDELTAEDGISEVNGSDLNSLREFLRSEEGYRGVAGGHLAEFLNAAEGNERQAELVTRFREILIRLGDAEQQVQENGLILNASNVTAEIENQLRAQEPLAQQRAARLATLNDRLRRLQEHLASFEEEEEEDSEEDPETEMNGHILEGNMGVIAESLMAPDAEDESGFVKKALRKAAEIAAGAGGGIVAKAALAGAVGALAASSPLLVVPAAMVVGAGGGIAARFLSSSVKAGLNSNNDRKKLQWLGLAKKGNKLLSPFKNMARNSTIKAYQLRENVSELTEVYNKLQDIDLDDRNAYTQASVQAVGLSREDLGQALSNLEYLKVLTGYGGIDEIENLNLPDGVDSRAMFNRLIMQLDAINRANGGDYLTGYQGQSQDRINKAYRSGAMRSIGRAVGQGAITGGLFAGALQIWQNLSEGTHWLTGQALDSNDVDVSDATSGSTPTDPDQFARNAAASARRSARAIAEQQDAVDQAREAANDLVLEQKEELMRAGISEDLYDQVNAQNPDIDILTPEEIDYVVDLSTPDVSADAVGGVTADTLDFVKPPTEGTYTWPEAMREYAESTNQPAFWQKAWTLGPKGGYYGETLQPHFVETTLDVLPKQVLDSDGELTFKVADWVLRNSWDGTNFTPVTEEAARAYAESIASGESLDMLKAITESAADGVGGNASEAADAVINLDMELINEAKESFTEWNPLNADVNQAVARLTSMERLSEQQAEAAKAALRELRENAAEAASEANTATSNLPQGEVAEAVGSHSENAANALDGVERVAGEAGGVADEVTGYSSFIVERTDQSANLLVETADGDWKLVTVLNKELLEASDQEIKDFAEFAVFAKETEQFVDGVSGGLDGARGWVYDQMETFANWMDDLGVPPNTLSDEDVLPYAAGVAGAGLVGSALLNKREASSGGVQPVNAEGNVVRTQAQRQGGGQNDDDDQNGGQQDDGRVEGDGQGVGERIRSSSVADFFRNLRNNNNDTGQQGNQGRGDDQSGGTNQQGGGNGQQQQGGNDRSDTNTQLNRIGNGETTREEALESVNERGDNQYNQRQLEQLAGQLGINIPAGTSEDGLRKMIVMNLESKPDNFFNEGGTEGSEQRQRAQQTDNESLTNDRGRIRFAGSTMTPLNVMTAIDLGYVETAENLITDQDYTELAEKLNLPRKEGINYDPNNITQVKQQIIDDMAQRVARGELSPYGNG